MKVSRPRPRGIGGKKCEYQVWLGKELWSVYPDRATAESVKQQFKQSGNLAQCLNVRLVVVPLKNQL